MYRVVAGAGEGVAYIVVENLDDHVVIDDAVRAVWGGGIMKAAGIPTGSVEYPIVLTADSGNGNSLNALELVMTSLASVAEGEVTVDELNSSRAAHYLGLVTPQSESTAEV